MVSLRSMKARVVLPNPTVERTSRKRPSAHLERWAIAYPVGCRIKYTSSLQFPDIATLVGGDLRHLEACGAGLEEECELVIAGEESSPATFQDRFSLVLSTARLRLPGVGRPLRPPSAPPIPSPPSLTPKVSSFVLLACLREGVLRNLIITTRLHLNLYFEVIAVGFPVGFLRERFDLFQILSE